MVYQNWYIAFFGVHSFRRRSSARPQLRLVLLVGFPVMLRRHGLAKPARSPG
jgi:hypothetical protein